MDCNILGSQPVAGSIHKIAGIKENLEALVSQLETMKDRNQRQCKCDGIRDLLQELDTITMTVGNLRLTQIGKFLKKIESQLPHELKTLVNDICSKWKNNVLQYRQSIKEKIAQCRGNNGQDIDFISVVVKEEALSQPEHIDLMTDDPNETSPQLKNDKNVQNVNSIVLLMKMFVNNIKFAVSESVEKISAIEEQVKTTKDSIAEISSRLDSFQLELEALLLNTIMPGNASVSCQDGNREDMDEKVNEKVEMNQLKENLKGIFSKISFMDSVDENNQEDLTTKGTTTRKRKSSTQIDNLVENVRCSTDGRVDDTAPVDTQGGQPKLQENKFLSASTRSDILFPNYALTDADSFKVPYTPEKSSTVLPLSQLNSCVNIRGNLIQPADDVLLEGGMNINDVALESFLSYSQTVEEMGDELENDDRQLLLDNTNKNRSTWNRICKDAQGVRYAPLVNSKGRLKAAHKASVSKQGIHSIVRKMNYNKAPTDLVRLGVREGK